MQAWIAWNSAISTWVKGRYTRRTFDSAGDPEPQDVEAKCDFCGQTLAQKCLSGRVRDHISKFAARHVHRDVFKP